MLGDLLPHHYSAPGCNDEERLLAREIADHMLQELENALQNGGLEEIQLPQVEAAVCHSAVELAVRANRTHYEDQVPINDTWDDHGEQESFEVGTMLTRWIRARLPQDEEERRALYHELRRGLLWQLAQECRHLRRLHMGFEQVLTMGIGEGAGRGRHRGPLDQSQGSARPDSAEHEGYENEAYHHGPSVRGQRSE